MTHLYRKGHKENRKGRKDFNARPYFLGVLCEIFLPTLRLKMRLN